MRHPEMLRRGSASPELFCRSQNKFFKIFIREVFSLISSNKNEMLPWLFESVGIFSSGLIEGSVTTKILSSRNRREKENMIEESQPFREWTLSVQDKIRPLSARALIEPTT
jgi:hypothetical protein